MSRQRLASAVAALRPCRSLHMNSPRILCFVCGPLLLVVVDRLQLLDPVVGCPLVAVDLGPWPDVASDDREKSLCSTVWDNAHDPQCWRVRGIAEPKHPDLVGGSSSSVMLGLVAKETLIDLHNYSQHQWRVMVEKSPAADVAAIRIYLYCSLLVDLCFLCCIFHWILSSPPVHEYYPLLELQA
ncbi:hypothetical protein GBAR_LOCUS12129 [Geodia barretti]|uniref:Uncharacterized protein n=1 Tax=Geodia barretti TaxID=519541 RepID=A0AA35S038_GEOBA|nr:hypothetical protein GBAR_LOCUS12129 [Geodia barretti]